jgi:hypothetical protein
LSANEACCFCGGGVRANTTVSGDRRQLAVSNFESDPNGDNYDEDCSFTFKRFQFKGQKECVANQVVSIISIDEIIRFILKGGVAAKLTGILVLWCMAGSTERNENPSENIRLTLQLKTPLAMYYVTCYSGKEEMLKNALRKPEMTGCIAFFLLLCSIWLFFGLFIMTVGTPISPSTAFQWSGVVIEGVTILMNLKTNLPLCYKQKHKTKTQLMCVEVPWCMVGPT